MFITISLFCAVCGNLPDMNHLMTNRFNELVSTYISTQTTVNLNHTIPVILNTPCITQSAIFYLCDFTFNHEVFYTRHESLYAEPHNLFGQFSVSLYSTICLDKEHYSNPTPMKRFRNSFLRSSAPTSYSSATPRLLARTLNFLRSLSL